MGKREVRVIAVSPAMSVVLLIAVSAAMLSLVGFLSGRAYVSESYSLLEALARRPSSREAWFAVSMPLIADVLLFVPWGFLLFIVADRPPLSRRQAYAVTFLAGLVFASSILVWQSFLPSRIITGVDAFAHALGALGGAGLAHLRRGVHIRFET